MSRRLTFCSDCGAFIPSTVDVCGGCGRSAYAADEPAPAPPAAVPVNDAPQPFLAAVPALAPAGGGSFDAIPAVVPASPSAAANKRPMIIAVALAIVVAVAGLILYLQRTSFNARLERALQQNHLFSPPGECVADIYAAERAKNPNSSEVRRAGDVIRARLEPIGEEAFRKWYVDSDGVDWDLVEKTCAFLGVLTNDARWTGRHEYAAGQLSLQAQNHNAALAHYSEVLRLDPRSALALNGIAKVYVQETSPLHNDALALQYYQQAAAVDPHFTWALKNLGEYYMRAEDWRNAEAYMLKALETSPNRPSILRALAKIYFNQKDYARALDYNQRYVAVEKDPVGIGKAQAAMVQIHEKLRR